ncbi:cation diffusion facilitator family transporter [Microdochium nivale]|nr:cation diffusion facilitator family transporter [Microdochium nivale]
MKRLLHDRPWSSSWWHTPAAATMEPDLSHSITRHPHVFQLHEHERSGSTRSSIRSPFTPPPLAGPDGHHDTNAVSTAVEAAGDDVDQHPVERHPSQATDVEMQPGQLRWRNGNDPFNLSSAFRTDAQLEQIRANTSRKREGPSGSSSGGGRKGPGGHKVQKANPRKVEGFYRTQNETIERLLKSVDDHRNEARQEQADDHLRFKIAVYGSFGANVILSILQLYGAISSGSLSLFTTMADSVFDPASNLMLILANRAVKKVDPSRFPSGKARLETAGNIAFSFLMTAVSLILICFSIRDLATHEGDPNETKGFHLPAVIAVAIAFVTKFSLFLYCWGIKDKYSQVDILWQDHRNDLLINGFGILTSVGGSKLVWWIDPMGAIVLSVLISCIWLRTAFQEFLLLVGVVASVEMQQLITYVSLTHSPEIMGIDTVRVYHSGPRLIAEVDIVMNPDASLRATHDVAEELQMKLENLPDIERAYVHVDFETTHKPEHFFKKDI